MPCNPSVYHAKKADEFNNPGTQDVEEENFKYYQNDEYENPEKGENQYIKTIEKPLEVKLDELKKNPKGGEAYTCYESSLLGEIMLDKREEQDMNVGLKESTPLKLQIIGGEPFGVLNQNTLESDRRPIPVVDKEKNIVLTPKTKEEQEAYNEFMNDLLERLAKAHNMQVDDVFKFVMTLGCDTINFEKVNHALLKLTEEAQPAHKKAVLPSKKSVINTKSKPIR